jgi:hypothetical protein
MPSFLPFTERTPNRMKNVEYGILNIEALPVSEQEAAFQKGWKKLIKYY